MIKLELQSPMGPSILDMVECLLALLIAGLAVLVQLRGLFSLANQDLYTNKYLGGDLHKNEEEKIDFPPHYRVIFMWKW